MTIPNSTPRYWSGPAVRGETTAFTFFLLASSYPDGAEERHGDGDARNSHQRSSSSCSSPAPRPPRPPPSSAAAAAVASAAAAAAAQTPKTLTPIGTRSTRKNVEQTGTPRKRRRRTRDPNWSALLAPSYWWRPPMAAVFSGPRQHRFSAVDVWRTGNEAPLFAPHTLPPPPPPPLAAVHPCRSPNNTIQCFISRRSTGR